jgi:hypothetical protein
METTPRDAEPAPDSPGPPPLPAGPAGDLGDIWQMLDALPPAAASVDLAATTVDLVAAKVAGAARSREREPVGLGGWLMRLAAVTAALAGGLVVGRATAPDPDRWVLDKLPLIEHLGLLREAGSVDFLEAVAERMAASQEPPRWLRYGRDPQALRDEAREFDAALKQLEADATARARGTDLLEARRKQVSKLPADKQADLERSADTFRGLSSLDKRELTAVAAALADPTNGRLRDAGRMWHVILEAMNPVFRRTVIEMPAADRLEMLERSPGRPREDFRDRRPNGDGDERRPPFGPPGPPQFGPPQFGPARPGNGPGRPGERPQGGLPGPPGFRPPTPPAAAPREAPAETPAPPR